MTEQRWKRTPGAWAVRIRGLAKRFGCVQAVSGLDMDVPLGGVHGLLGPNGSGKTTTLRMLLGLIRPDDGEMRIFDHEVPCGLPEVIDRVGAIVENPTFAPNMSLRRNLEILAISTGVPSRRVTEVLLEVGLRGREKAAFHTCSLGMKQRLAIAATLLREPDLLIFDEPTNGLDPAGIQEIRTTMRALADAGRTVVVASHLLGEIEQIADSVSIMGRGRVIATGELEEFLNDGSGYVAVEIDDVPAAFETLRQAGFDGQLVGEQVRVTRDEGLDPAAVARVLGEADLWPRHLSLQRSSLESVFLELTEDERLTTTQGRAVA